MTGRDGESRRRRTQTEHRNTKKRGSRAASRGRDEKKGRTTPMKYEQMTIAGMNIQTTTTGKTQAMKLRERMEAERGFEYFDDEDTLTAIIGLVNQTAKAPQIADKLLDTFGSLKGVLEARPEQLRTVSGVGEKMAFLLSAVVPLVRLWNRKTMATPEHVSNSRDAENFCKSLLLGLRTEAFYVVSLNAKCNILGVRKVSEGSLSEVSAYPRIVMESALNHNAHSVLLCHNHPGGTCAPSPEDIASTQQLQQLLGGVGILVLDHIIVANNQTYSMIQHGDIDYRLRRPA